MKQDQEEEEEGGKEEERGATGDLAEASKEGEVPSGGGIAREGYLGQGREGKMKGEKGGNVHLTKEEKRPRTLKT